MLEKYWRKIDVNNYGNDHRVKNGFKYSAVYDQYFVGGTRVVQFYDSASLVGFLADLPHAKRKYHGFTEGDTKSIDLLVAHFREAKNESRRKPIDTSTNRLE